MKSILIADTTREERERIVAESIGNIEGACDGCSPGLLKMYEDYIEGKKELRQINMEFNRRYVSDAEGPGRRTPVDAIVPTNKDMDISPNALAFPINVSNAVFRSVIPYLASTSTVKSTQLLCSCGFSGTPKSGTASLKSLFTISPLFPPLFNNHTPHRQLFQR